MMKSYWILTLRESRQLEEGGFDVVHHFSLLHKAPLATCWSVVISGGALHSASRRSWRYVRMFWGVWSLPGTSSEEQRATFWWALPSGTELWGSWLHRRPYLYPLVPKVQALSASLSWLNLHPCQERAWSWVAVLTVWVGSYSSCTSHPDLAAESIATLEDPTLWELPFLVWKKSLIQWDYLEILKGSASSETPCLVTLPVVLQKCYTVNGAGSSPLPSLHSFTGMIQ